MLAAKISTMPTNRLLNASFAGYLKGAEEVVALKKAYETSGSQKYTQLLTMMQNIYSKEVLPTLEEDAHGLIADCTFVGQPGNIAFFNDPSNTITGFEGFNKAGLGYGSELGICETAICDDSLRFRF